MGTYITLSLLESIHGFLYIARSFGRTSVGSLGGSGGSLEPHSPPPFLDILWKCTNLVSVSETKLFYLHGIFKKLLLNQQCELPTPLYIYTWTSFQKSWIRLWKTVWIGDRYFECSNIFQAIKQSFYVLKCCNLAFYQWPISKWLETSQKVCCDMPYGLHLVRHSSYKQTKWRHSLEKIVAFVRTFHGVLCYWYSNRKRNICIKFLQCYNYFSGCMTV